MYDSGPVRGGSSGSIEPRPGGSCKILGVLMTLRGPFGTNLELLGVLDACFLPIFRDIGGAIAPPAPPVPPALDHSIFEKLQT